MTEESALVVLPAPLMALSRSLTVNILGLLELRTYSEARRTGSPQHWRGPGQECGRMVASGPQPGPGLALPPARSCPAGWKPSPHCGDPLPTPRHVCPGARALSPFPAGSFGPSLGPGVPCAFTFRRRVLGKGPCRP